MADRRRRRPKIANSDSECSEEEDVVAAKREQKLSEGGKSCTSNDGSDEDSATEDNEDETGEEEETEEGTEYEEEEEEEGQYKGGVKGERQSGDGQEQPESLDDDEDRKNPAYIPRRGAFYEHDTRISDEVDPKEAARAQKKLWVDKGKWGHDRFVDTFQAPKSTEEIIAEYGYDIRAYDTPPDAPPKSFGRGRRDHNRSNKLSDFIDMGAGGDGYHNNRGGYPPRGRGRRGARSYGGDGGRYTYSQVRDGGDARNYVNNQKQFEDKYDQDYPSRDDRPERNRGGYHDNRSERNRGSYHDDRPNRNRGSYHDDRPDRIQGSYHDNRSDRNKDSYHDDRPDRNQGSYYDDRPERNRGSYQDDRSERNQRGNSQEKYYDRGDGYEYDSRPSQSMGRGGRGGRGVVTTETLGEEDDLRSPPRNRQWTNSNTRGGANKRGSGPSLRGNARYPPQSQQQQSSTQASEYPPTTTAPPSRSSQDQRNVDRPPAENTNVNVNNQTQDVRHSKVGRPRIQETSAYGRNHPSEPRVESDNRARQNKVAVPPSIVPPTTVASTKLRHTSDRRGTTDSGVTSTASKHDTAATTVPSGGTTQNRPKRYSSQRQRNAPEVVAYQEPVATDTQPPPAPAHVAPRGLTSPPRPLRRPAPQAYFQPVYATQPPTVFHPRADRSPPHTVASFPRQHPPHLLAYTIPGTNQLQSPPQIYNAVPAAMAPPPPPASMATAQPTPIIAPQYIAGAPMLNYVQPAQPAPYQMATGPAAMQFPAPQQPQPQPQPQQPQQQDAIHMRGGTVYFNPDVQQQLIPLRSPVRRVKVAIPIVNPEEVVQNQGMYIQINDNQQPAYAPTYYHLTTADFDQYDQEDDTEYDDMEDARPDAEAEAAEPEFYECVEPASGSADEGGNSQETSDAVSRKTPDTSEEIVHKDDRTSTDGSRDVDSVKNIESESSSASTNENKTTEVTVIEENVRTENERDIATVKVESETVVGDSEQTSAEIAEDDTTQSDKTSEERIKSESDPICADTVDGTSEASDHETDHACEDHTTTSDQETAEAACVENNSRKNECGHTEIEIHPVSADEGSAKSETTNNETYPESVDHVSNPKQHLEGEASSAKELDIDLDEGKTDLANTNGEVSTRVSEGDSENRQIETENELAGSEEVSFKTETTTNEASDKNVKEVSEVNHASVVEGNASIKTETTTNEASDKYVKEVSEVNHASVVEGNASTKTETTTNEASDKNVEEVSQVNNASVMGENASSVDTEEGSGSTDVIKEEITETISPDVDSSSTSDVKIEEPVSGGMPV